MSDPVVPDEGPGERSPTDEHPKVRKKHTVAKVLLAAVLALSISIGLGVVYFYHHLNGNLAVIQTKDVLENRPEKEPVDGTQESLSILVMGSDSRDCDGCDLDNETGGEASDTTILFHLSADRERAYGVSIPRDTIVDRPACKAEGGSRTEPATDVMWNEAFSVGGPTCTWAQFESLTGVFIDHMVVVDFAGFEDMVNAIGGVPVCIPEDIVDPEHGINIPAGTREIEGREALNYVRARYTLGNGSDIGRIKRQQAFIAAMAEKAISAGTLARVDRLARFLNAATKSLTVDEGLENVIDIARIGVSFQDIGLGNIQFLTAPNDYYPSDSDLAGRVFLLESAEKLWQQLANDEPLGKQFTGDAISAGRLPGQSDKPKTPEEIAAAQERAQEDGLCT